MKKLYRLKSNTNTIVEKVGDFHRVYWSVSMNFGKSSTWMMHRWNEENVQLLGKEDTELFIMKSESFHK